MLTEFVIGERYTNDQISISLRVENLGGIRPALDSSKNLRHIAVMTNLGGRDAKNAIENPYHDRVEGNILTFTGQGRVGDQELVGRNKRIAEQFGTPIPIFCFESCGRQTYIFRGLLELLRFFRETQIDSAHKIRKVLIYEFVIHPEVHVVPIEMARAITESLLPSDRQQPIYQSEQEVIVHEDVPSAFAGYDSLTIEDIRSRLLCVNPYRFEYLLKSLLEKTGFQNVSVTSPSQDGGIDLNAYVAQDNIFFANTVVQFQAKRWRHSVGSVEINNFRGAISSMAKGVFVTTSFFTKAAIQEAKHPSKPSIALIDGFSLSSLINDVQLEISRFEGNVDVTSN